MGVNMVPQKNCSIWLLQRMLVIFWALWWTVAFATDVLGVLQHVHWIPGTMFDGNYALVKKGFGNYVSSDIVPVLGFGFLLFWEFLCAVFLVRASLLSFNEEKWFSATMTAFIISIAMWMIYFVGDQILLLFDIETGDMPQAGLQFISLIMILLLRKE